MTIIIVSLLFLGKTLYCNTTVFYSVNVCGLADIYCSFAGTCYLHQDGRCWKQQVPRNVGKYLQSTWRHKQKVTAVEIPDTEMCYIGINSVYVRLVGCNIKESRRNHTLISNIQNIFSMEFVYIFMFQ